MTDVIINKETGLPELPEGYFWEIAANGQGVYEFIIADGNSLTTEWLRVSLVDDAGNPIQYYYPEEGWDNNLYVSRIVDSLATRSWSLTGVTRNYSADVEEPIAKFWPLSKFTIMRTKSLIEYEAAKAKEVFKSALQDYTEFDWSSESIQRVASQTYREWQEQSAERRKAAERRQKIADVLGTYPPKSISVVD